MKRSTSLAAIAVGACAVVGVGALGAGPASADPSGTPTFRVLTLAGSDTTQDVMNGFAAAITASGSDYRASGLLQAAAAAGDTSVKTSLAPAVGDSITIGTGGVAETFTVTAVTPAVANTLSTTPGNAINYNVVTLSGPLANAHSAKEIVVGPFLAAGTKVMASFNSQGGAFQSKTNANCQFIANNAGATGSNYSGTTQGGSVQTGTNSNATYLSGARANGSGNGARAMADAFDPTNPTFGCIDAARASSKRSNVTGLGAGKAVNIPFALDGVDFGVTTTSNYTRKLSWSDLKAIYRCTYSGMIPATTVIPAGTSTQAYAAQNGLLYATLPQAGSGTRQFVVAALGLTESATAASGNTGAACITDKTPTGGVLEEHNLTTIDDNGIGVTSIAQSITQRASAISGVSDKQGRTVLVAIDNTAAANGGTPNGNGKLNYAVTMTSQFGGGTSGAGVLWRDVFNVVPLDRLSDPNIQAAFVGAGSSICQDTTGVLAQYGFAPNPNCGVTTNVG